MIYAAIMLGLLGSLHCVGMCGPITLVLPQGKNFSVFLFNRLIYNSGRIITYICLGLLLGFIGEAFGKLGIQQWLSMALGLMMFIFAIFSFRLNYNLAVPSILPKLVSRLKTAMSRYLKLRGSMATFIVGLLNGFLPCGLVYLAMASALAFGSIYEAGLFMAVFGLGTIPALMITAFAGRVASSKFRTQMLRLSPVLICTLAMMLFLRGYFIQFPQTEPGIGFMLQETICGIRH